MAKNNNLIKEERVVLFYLSRYFYWILILAILLILTGFYFLILYPQLSKSDVMRFFTYKNEVEQLDYLKQQKNEVSDIFVDFQKFSKINLQQLENILPSEKDIPDLIIQLDNFTRQSGLVLSSFSISEQPTNNDQQESAVQVKELPVSLNIGGGDYNQLKYLVGLIETNMRLMDVVSFGFSGDENRGFIMNLKTYFYN